MYLLANFVSIIRNNINLKKESVDVPFSLLIQKCLIILLNEGFILGFKKLNTKEFRVFLKYYKGKSVINTITCLSTPGFRKYITISDLKKNYNQSNLLILSTSKGIFSNFDLMLKLNSKFSYSFNISKSVIQAQSNSFFTEKFINFSSVNHPMHMTYVFNKLSEFNLNNVFFHKNTILTSYYRKKGLITRLSKKQCILNKNLIKNLRSYLSKNSSILDKTLDKASQIKFNINNLYFFKFKNYFSNYKYLNFKKNLNFFKFIKLINQKHNFSVFYFLFYIKQFSFSKYKYRFSLYLKYINRLIKLNNLIKKKSLTNLNDILGGEILISIN